MGLSVISTFLLPAFIPGIVKTAFCQNTGIQSKVMHNKVKYSVHQGGPSVPQGV